MRSIFIYTLILLGLYLSWLSTRPRFKSGLINTVLYGLSMGFIAGGIVSLFPALDHESWPWPLVLITFGAGLLPTVVELLERRFPRHS